METQETSVINRSSGENSNMSMELLRISVTGFDLMTCDSYFTILVEVFTDHILVENTYHELATR